MSSLFLLPLCKWTWWQLGYPRRLTLLTSYSQWCICTLLGNGLTLLPPFSLCRIHFGDYMVLTLQIILIDYILISYYFPFFQVLQFSLTISFFRHMKNRIYAEKWPLDFNLSGRNQLTLKIIILNFSSPEEKFLKYIHCLRFN